MVTAWRYTEPQLASTNISQQAVEADVRLRRSQLIGGALLRTLFSAFRPIGYGKRRSDYWRIVFADSSPLGDCSEVIDALDGSAGHDSWVTREDPERFSRRILVLTADTSGVSVVIRHHGSTHRSRPSSGDPGSPHPSDPSDQINQGSLYPALHRLEHQGWIEAEWAVSELGRRAKYYRLTPAGRRQLTTEANEWERMSTAIGRVMKLA